MARKSWKEKYTTRKDPVVEIVEGRFADIPAGATMLIATPRIVDEYIQHIPRGKCSDVKTMRKDLAAAYHAEYTCPVTSGIFLRIVAEKAWEELQEGIPEEKITPFWRMIAPESPAAKKLTFGTTFIEQKRKEEGID
jgi:hypothetical protein